MATAGKAHRLYEDIPFLTGLYILILSIITISNTIAVPIEETGEPGGLLTVFVDLAFFCSGISMLGVMLLIAGVRLRYLPVILVPIICYIVHIYFYLGPRYQSSTEVLWHFDFWNFLAVAMLCTMAFLRKELSQQDYLALAGWTLFIFGNVLLKCMGYLISDEMRYVQFIPTIAALVFWVPSLIPQASSELRTIMPLMKWIRSKWIGS